VFCHRHPSCPRRQESFPIPVPWALPSANRKRGRAGRRPLVLVYMEISNKKARHGMTKLVGPRRLPGRLPCAQAGMLPFKWILAHSREKERQDSEKNAKTKGSKGQ